LFGVAGGGEVVEPRRELQTNEAEFTYFGLFGWLVPDEITVPGTAEVLRSEAKFGWSDIAEPACPCCLFDAGHVIFFKP